MTETRVSRPAQFSRNDSGISRCGPPFQGRSSGILRSIDGTAHTLRWSQVPEGMLTATGRDAGLLMPLAGLFAGVNSDHNLARKKAPFASILNAR